MKIWIIGKKCGLIKVITKRLQKEGHEVHANISEDKISKFIDINNVNYNFDSTTQITKKAFDDFNPDMVIYTGYYDEAFNENEKSSKHLSELINILNLCINSSVSRFLYLSSYEVYENIDGGMGCTETMDLKPESIRSYRLLESENLVKRWSEFTKKISIIFRIAPVYGEISRESWNNFNNLNVLVDIKNNKDVDIPFSAANPVHIYDLTDAIVKSFDLVTVGIYNVAGNELLTNWTFGNVLKGGIAKDSESRFNVGEELRIILDTKRIKNDLEWTPKYNSYKGVRVSIENNKKVISNTIKDRRNEDNIDAKRIFHKREFFKRLLLTLEVPLVFLIVVVIYYFNRDMNIFDYVDIFIIYIVIVSSIHGVSKSLFAPIFSSIYLIGLKFFQGYDLVNSLFNVSNIIIIIQYFLVWAIIS
jgi:nucleoside-diphosphate-sugar epimerase